MYIVIEKSTSVWKSVQLLDFTHDARVRMLEMFIMTSCVPRYSYIFSRLVYEVSRWSFVVLLTNSDPSLLINH